MVFNKIIENKYLQLDFVGEMKLYCCEIGYKK